jgi:hypothetical protein
VRSLTCSPHVQKHNNWSEPRARFFNGPPAAAGWRRFSNAPLKLVAPGCCPASAGSSFPDHREPPTKFRLPFFVQAGDAAGSTFGTPRQAALSPTRRCRRLWGCSRNQSCFSFRPGHCQSAGKCWPGRSSPSSRFLPLRIACAWPASLRRIRRQLASADRQTEGVGSADHALDVARSKRDEACGRGLGKTVACKVRQAEVTKLDAVQVQATAKVVAQARPESTDFARLVAWVSRGAVHRGAMILRCSGCYSGHSCRRSAGLS